MADLAAPGGTPAPIGATGPDFGDFLGATRPDLLKRARRLTFGHGDAEDLVQDTLMKAWATHRRPSKSWRSWLYVILRNTVIDWRRRELLPPEHPGGRWLPRWESIETAPGPAGALDRLGARRFQPRPTLEPAGGGATRRPAGETMVASSTPALPTGDVSDPYADPYRGAD